ncbi:DNA mismatch repair endonuclease MutL [Truepera radiovictrix]|uniref:DNA mismatch repair protein MutL n=1 Tax=Truepera radiovictrix (strain DSM 17093 / CIP 108686 / LMG 22925 / RQ-24) TaxID=649638 RepID=D7CU67_TRURR|nr:DNA mismatch repair endonuclease MutL [Truepera radiovictrix]ADI13965.1 DNA mismatch repair protein MutL [Truepera radiovictrix DSM 17093]WMT57471.1 DNA mismatch repair endonuclease MutL [Truepera radiovictrix]
MAPIRRLPPEVVREIAAGEVVTAPADVLKELLENALDAGATRLEVALDGGGTERVAVRDNGAGIPAAELPRAVEAHSTSKLSGEDAGAALRALCTLGFRGEGLYAIRHAARLCLTSRPAAQLGGASLEAFGDEVALRTHPAPQGTLAVVTDLFARLPARRAALGSASAESRRALALLSRYLLHHPHLHVSLEQDGETRWRYAGGGFREAVKFLWGAVTANRLLGVAAEGEGYALAGLLSRPELSRPRRDRLLLAVNGRPVEWDEELLKAVTHAYRELLRAGHFPVGVLNLTVPPEQVLVNTAPDKSRVRFLAPEALAAFLREAVRATLGANPLAPSLPELQAPPALFAAPRHRFPALRYLGVYRELYLLAEGEGQLWVVDQHAAHERVLFEELERRYRQEPPVELPAPELLPLSPEEEATYAARREALRAAGLELEPFGGGRYRVRRVPAFLLGHPELLPGVVSGALGRRGADEAWRAVLARLACLPAIKAGRTLKDPQALLDALARCETPWACPHGRPTALVLSELELARRFGRRGVRAVPAAPPDTPEVPLALQPE